MESDGGSDRGSHLMLFCALLMLKKGFTVEQCFRLTPLTPAARALALDLRMPETQNRPAPVRH